MPGSNELDETSIEESGGCAIQDIPEHDAADYIPNFLQSFNDYSKVCRRDVS
jgi:hypothetical protein